MSTSSIPSSFIRANSEPLLPEHRVTKHGDFSGYASLESTVRGGGHYAQLMFKAKSKVAHQFEAFFDSEAFVEINKKVQGAYQNQEAIQEVINDIRKYWMSSDNPQGILLIANQLRGQILEANSGAGFLLKSQPENQSDETGVQVEDDNSIGIFLDSLMAGIHDPKHSNVQTDADFTENSHDTAIYEFTVTPSLSTKAKRFRENPTSTKYLLSIKTTLHESLSSSPLAVLILRAIHERLIVDQLERVLNEKKLFLAEPVTLKVHHGVSPGARVHVQFPEFEFSCRRNLGGVLNLREKESFFDSLPEFESACKELTSSRFQAAVALSRTVYKDLLEPLQKYKMEALEHVLTSLASQLRHKALEKWVSVPLAHFLMWRNNNATVSFVKDLLFWLVNINHTQDTKHLFLKSQNFQAALNDLRSVQSSDQSLRQSLVKSDESRPGLVLIECAARQLAVLHNQINSCASSMDSLNSMGRADVNGLLRDAVGEAMGITTPKDLALFDLICRAYRTRNLSAVKEPPTHSGLYNVLQDMAGFHSGASLEVNLKSLTESPNRTELTPHLVGLLHRVNNENQSEPGIFDMEGEEPLN